MRPTRDRALLVSAAVTPAVAFAYQVFFVDLETGSWGLLILFSLAIHCAALALLVSTCLAGTLWTGVRQVLAATAVIMIVWLPPKDWRYVSYLWRHKASLQDQMDTGLPYQNLEYLFSPRREVVRYTSMMWDDLYFIRARWGLGTNWTGTGIPVKSVRHLWGPWYYAHVVD